MTENDLIQAIDDFAAKRGIAGATVTKYAVENSQLYGSLKSGGSCSLKTANKILLFIANNAASEDAEVQ